MENKKIYEQKWFIVTMIVLIFPIGLLLMWKSDAFTDKSKKIISGVIAVLVVITLFAPEPPSAESTYEVQAAEITYMTEDTPGADAVYEDAKTYTTALSGEYTIGIAPKDLTSGEETEFTTAQSGNYIAGEDFPVGMYDLEVVSGSGNVMGTNLNEIMGTGDSYFGDLYVAKYDNHYFSEGDTLEVSGVSIKLVPQNNDAFVIMPNTYNVISKQGSGNVIGTGINEIMGEGSAGFEDMYVNRFDNLKLKEGDSFTTNGVVVELQPKESKVLVTEATDPIPGHEQTETLSVSTFGETCEIDSETVECDKLAKYEDLKASLELSKTVTEKVVFENDNYRCMSDDQTVDCDKLYDYDNLVKQIEQKK